MADILLKEKELGGLNTVQGRDACGVAITLTPVMVYRFAKEAGLIQAQLKKIAEWGNKPCAKHARWHDEFPRHECLKCWWEFANQ